MSILLSGKPGAIHNAYFRPEEQHSPDWLWETHAKFSAPRVDDTFLNQELNFVIPPSDPLSGSTKITLTQLLTVLRLISRLANPTMPFAPIPKRGTKVDTALRRWVFDMRRLWEWRLNRKFTRDVGPGGEPISEAARFCVEVYQEMLPGQPHSRVLNEMKITIRAKRDWLEELRAKD